MIHVPVLLAEVLDRLDPHEGESYLDLTLGAGGHAAAIARRLGPQGLTVGVDRDTSILEHARLALEGHPAEFVHGDFGDLPALTERLPRARFDMVLADVGVSSLQLDDPRRGFSFRESGPLDMRMDRSHGATAAEYLADVSERELARVVGEYGEERFARRVAREIVESRQRSRIETTGELAEIVRRAVPRTDKRLDPATRTFQAIRIAVNRELDALDHLLQRFGTLLAPGGRFGVIAFHSLEDRRVKNAFRDLEREGGYRVRTSRPDRPSEEEIRRNPRARSARLRVIEKD